MRMFFLTGALALALAADFAVADPQSVDVTVQGAPTPPKCNFIDAYYLNCSLARSAAVKRQQDERQKVGGLMADGSCDDALKVALRSGDFDMAAKVKSLCVQQASPPRAVPPPASSVTQGTDSETILAWGRNNIHADGWKFIKAAGGNVLLYEQDEASPSPKGFVYYYVRAEFLNTLREGGKEIRSGRSVVELDCTKRLQRIGRQVAYAANNLSGTVVGDDKTPTAWSPVQAGSGYADEMAARCK